MRHTEAELAQVLHTGPFHLALRTALSVRGLPLQRVQHHLAHRGVKVGVTSLSYWQQGARRPQRPESLRAVKALEEVLELPGNSLLRLLGSGNGRPEADRPAARSYRSLMESSGSVERLLAAMGSPVDGGLHTVGHHERVRIGPGRELRQRESQHVVRAHRDDIDRYLAVHRGDPGCDPARVTVTAGENCRTGRVRWDRGTGVLVAELLFDTRLRAGDTYLFGYGFDDGTGGPSGEYVRGSASAADSTCSRWPSTRPRCRYGAALRPGLGGGAARRPHGPHTDRQAPDRSPGGAGGSARSGRHRLGLGVSPFPAGDSPTGDSSAGDSSADVRRRGPRPAFRPRP